MFELNNQDRKFLQTLGRRPDGKRFAAILEKAVEHYSSISSIDSGEDQAAQVEGRKLFCKFARQMVDTIKSKAHNTVAIDHDDYT